MLLRAPGPFSLYHRRAANDPQRGSMTESRTREWAAELEGQPAGDVLAWAAHQFAPRVGFGTGFGAEGCVLVHLIAEQDLPIDVFTIDTGLLFDETYEPWQRLVIRYGGHPPGSPSAVCRRTDGRVRRRTVGPGPHSCCAIRKVAPLQDALVGMDALVTAIRRNQTPQRARAAIVERDVDSECVRINPLAGWTRKTCGHSSDGMRFPTTRCTTADIRASVALPARRPSLWARIPAPGAGAGAKKPSAACTAPPQCRCSSCI